MIFTAETVRRKRKPTEIDRQVVKPPEIMRHAISVGMNDGE